MLLRKVRSEVPIFDNQKLFFDHSGQLQARMGFLFLLHMIFELLRTAGILLLWHVLVLVRILVNIK